jgi:hypothetical protein
MLATETVVELAPFYSIADTILYTSVYNQHYLRVTRPESLLKLVKELFDADYYLMTRFWHR